MAKAVLRFDNERAKGDHKDIRDVESTYTFIDPETLIADFQAAIRDVEGDAT